jgi:hypothetical protein
MPLRESFNWSATALANAGKFMKSDVFVCIYQPHIASFIVSALRLCLKTRDGGPSNRNPLIVPISATRFLIE